MFFHPLYFVVGSLLVLCTRVDAQVVKPKPVSAKAKHETKPLAVVTVKTQSEVVGSAFTLAEVADIRGKDAAFVAQLRAVSLGTAPLPGYSRILNRGDIIVKLRGSHLDENKVELVSPSQFRVSRARNEVSSARVLAAAIEATKPLIADAPEVSLIPDLLPSVYILPPGTVTLETGLPRGKVENGTLTVPVLLKTDGKISQTIEVVLRVKRKMRVVISTRTLEPGDILSADDVSLAVIELPNGFVRPMTSTREAKGKRVKRRILADAPISGISVETPPLIAVNDRVILEYAVGVVGVSVTGIARQAGSAGTLIRIYLPETRKELEVYIVDRNTVRLPGNAE